MKKQSKLACTLLILCTTFAWTGCSDDDNPIRNTPTPEPEVSKDLSLAWRDPIAADSAALLIPGENDTLVVRATNATALTLNEAAEGWKAVVKDDSLVIVTAPDEVKGADKFDLTLTATGEGDKTLTLKAAFRRILFDDPKGVFVLNEGNMSNETGTLLYITPEGELIDSIYARVNGSLLGNVTQDMKFYGDNVYFISQNGNKASLGGEFQADGMLIIANRHTMKRVQAFTHEEMKDLKWPTHIAVVDENTIFIRDNKGVWKFNPTSKELTFMEGSEKAVKQPFVVLQGKAFTFSTLQSGVSMSLLSFDAASTKATKVSVGYDFKKLNAIGYRDENSLYVAGVFDYLQQSYLCCYNFDGNRLNRDGFVYISAPIESRNGFASSWFTAKDDEVYYLVGSMLSHVTYKAGEKLKAKTKGPDDDSKTFKASWEDELLDVYDLGDNASIIYNGVAIHPVTGEIYLNTLKGFGENYKTNNIWRIDPAKKVSTRTWENHTAFPAGIFFNPQK